jgi:hypothetical protein
MPCRRTTPCGPSTADGCSPPAASGASCGTSTASSVCSANAILRVRDTYDCIFTEWIYGNTALFPEDEPPMYPTIPLDSIDVADEPAEEPREVVAVA